MTLEIAIARLDLFILTITPPPMMNRKRGAKKTWAQSTLRGGGIIIKNV